MTTDMPASRPVATRDAYDEVVRKIDSVATLAAMLPPTDPNQHALDILRTVGMLPPPPVLSTDTCRWLAADEDGQWWQCTNYDEDHDGQHEAEFGFTFGDDDREVIAPPERIRFVWALDDRTDRVSWRTPQAGAVVHKKNLRGPMGYGLDDALWFTACGALHPGSRPVCGHARQEQPDPSWTLCANCFPAS